MTDPNHNIIAAQRDEIERLKTVLRRQDFMIDKLRSELDQRGPWPKGPKGARVVPPVYEMHPFRVSYVFGGGWTLFKHLPASGATAKISQHDSCELALAALGQAHAAGPQP